MPLEFGDDFCSPCEPIAWTWYEGNELIGHSCSAIIVVVDVDLHGISLVHRDIFMISILLTA